MSEKTVADIAAVVRRTKQALSEAGRPDLARTCAIEVLRALELDLVFMADPVQRLEPDA